MIKSSLGFNHCFLNKDEWVRELVHAIREEKPYFKEAVEPKTLNSVVCLRPRMNNPRIIRQDGYFFAFGVDGKKDRPASILKRWIQEPVVIPAPGKPRILAELAAMNIDEAFVYPDFHHVKNVIKKRYSARKNPAP